MSQILPEQLNTPGLLFTLFFGIAIIYVFTLIFLTSVRAGNARPESVGKATFCYLMQSVGIILMSAGALPTVASVISSSPLYSTPQYLGYILLFAIGGIVYLRYDQRVQRVSLEARLLPFIIFLYTFKIIGSLAVILGATSLFLRVILPFGDTKDWWTIPIVMLIYGLIVSFTTQELPENKTADVKPRRKKVTKKKST